MKAVIFALLSALVWGTAPLIFKLGLRGDVPPLVGIFFHNLTASIFALVSMLILKEGFSYPLRDITIISFGGFVSGFLGLLLYYKAIKLGDVSVVAPIVASSPLWASLFAFVLLGEHFTPMKLVGTILVVTGVVLITLSR
ncbi:transporter family protein [Hydrogenivirga caldilitoris]|uniref:Transporter family protein n=1 Tax=Hydrogenivirga caldilitoris TaxID=246264 RepID=A0A497XNW4_9AQUI|nr:EamA family transporter [Hydrogenivirga caldilitoris]RLJ70656.1 transporter family protein [Hydrogenivirga caldilitoris]